MSSSVPPLHVQITAPSSFGFLSPPIDTGDASSDDGDTLQTPLTEHDEHRDAYNVYQEGQHGFSPDMLTSFLSKQQEDALLGGTTSHDLNAPTLSHFHPFSSLPASSASQSSQNLQQDCLFSLSSPSQALDLANASLEITFASNEFMNRSLDPRTSSFTSAKESFDLSVPPIYSSSPSDPSSSSWPDLLGPLPSLSFDSLAESSTKSSIESIRSLLSPNPLIPRSSESENILATRGRMYSPRFPAEHTLNQFFVRAYCLGDELGAGGYGFVMTARHRTEGHEVAVKFIIKEKVPDHAWWEDEAFGRIPTEVMLLSLVDHPNVVKCLDLYEDEVYFYMVQELHGTPWESRKKKKSNITAPGKLVAPTSTPSLTPSLSFESTTDSVPPTPPSVSVENVDALSTTCETSEAAQDAAHITRSENPHIALPSLDLSAADAATGKTQNQTTLQPLLPVSVPVRPNFSRRASHDLFECIEQSKHKRLSENQARYIFAQVVEAVYYLDSQGITHCDIKDENLLVDSDLKVKLIDFGSAVVADPSVPRPHYTLFFGTTAYASSEILRKQPYRAPPAEIWTLGVLLSYLLTGHSPFATEQDAIDGRVLLREPSSGRLSRAAVTLIGRCLERDPERRADIEEVRGHRWLQGALERDARE